LPKYLRIHSADTAEPYGLRPQDSGIFLLSRYAFENFGRLVGATDVTGELSYAKPKQTRSRGLHLDGLETILVANGSLYSGQDALLEGAGTLQLTGGDLASDESHSVTITAGVPAVPTGALKAWTGVTQRTGTFNAKITVPSIAKPVTGRGVYLPKSDRAWGWFPGKTIGGRIELTVP
jgi:hypothetical protein